MQNGQFVTMPSVYGMIKAQRKAAEETGVAFWNTFEAMGGENSMVAFVEKKWASQDHTHIRYPGGKFIAKELTAALIENANANGSISDAERLPFLHDLESGYDPSPAKRGGNTVICSCIKRDPTKHKLLHRHDKRVKKRKKLLKMKRLNNSRFPIRY